MYCKTLCRCRQDFHWLQAATDAGEEISSSRVDVQESCTGRLLATLRGGAVHQDDGPGWPEQRGLCGAAGMQFEKPQEEEARKDC